jgi:hypothetical protein
MEIMRPHPILFTAAFLLVVAAAPRSVRAQLGSPASEAADPTVAMSLDSLRRVINLRVLSDADKKAIRACDRDKSRFLKEARAAEPGYAQVDKSLNEAKLAGADPNEPSIQALMEKKFTFEKSFDQRFYATPVGRKCSEGDERHAKALAKALEKDKEYQALLKKARNLPSQSL